MKAETAIEKMRDAGFKVEFVEFLRFDGWEFYDYQLKISPKEKLSDHQRRFIAENRLELIQALRREWCITRRNETIKRGGGTDNRRFCHECQHLNGDRCRITRLRQWFDDMPRHCSTFLAINPDNQP